jgi:hypothetical protein
VGATKCLANRDRVSFSDQLVNGDAVSGPATFVGSDMCSLHVRERLRAARAWRFASSIPRPGERMAGADGLLADAQGIGVVFLAYHLPR